MGSETMYARMLSTLGWLVSALGADAGDLALQEESRLLPLKTILGYGGTLVPQEGFPLPRRRAPLFVSPPPATTSHQTLRRRS